MVSWPAARAHLGMNGTIELSPQHLARGFRGLLSPELCATWTRGVYSAREAWITDFDGEQFSLGRAFYTHLEQGRSRDYFAEALASDARVERSLPGLQVQMRAIAGALLHADVRPRAGWCGAGVHIFPAGEKVARHGGVIHSDTEGLTRHHIERRAPAMTLVAMLQSPTEGGGLRVWDHLHGGTDALNDEDLDVESAILPSVPGDIWLFDSYRVHQIQPFGGERDRVSITLHAAQVEPGIWESWF